VAISLLEQRGHTVVLAVNGKEAVEAFEKETFDAVLMDIQMPEMDGFEATARILELQQQTGQSTPVIAMTAHAMKGDKERCLAAGMAGYISKPLHKDTLYQTLEELVLGVENASNEEEKPTAVDEQVFNLQEALDRVGGDQAILKELIELFFQECPKLMKAINDAISSGDLNTLRREAHTLKGTADVFCAKQVVNSALAIEMMAREENLSHVDAVWHLLEEDVERLVAVLEKCELN